MKKIGGLFVPLLLTLALCAGCGGGAAGGGSPIRLEAGGRVFFLRLEDNETARAFEAMLPMTLEMSDLNANEKYCYLKNPLPSKPEAVGAIRAGDVLMFGEDCVVVFYKSFSTSYRYTRIGRVEDAAALESALGSENVTVSFGQ